MNNRIICLVITILLNTLATSHSTRAQTNGTATTAAKREEAWWQHVELERMSPYKRLKWRALGPTSKFKEDRKGVFRRYKNNY